MKCRKNVMKLQHSLRASSNRIILYSVYLYLLSMIIQKVWLFLQKLKFMFFKIFEEKGSSRSVPLVCFSLAKLKLATAFLFTETGYSVGDLNHRG